MQASSYLLDSQDQPWIVRYLPNSGADVNGVSRSNEPTPLQMACRNHHSLGILEPFDFLQLLQISPRISTANHLLIRKLEVDHHCRVNIYWGTG